MITGKQTSGMRESICALVLALSTTTIGGSGCATVATVTSGAVIIPSGFAYDAFKPKDLPNQQNPTQKIDVIKKYEGATLPLLIPIGSWFFGAIGIIEGGFRDIYSVMHKGKYPQDDFSPLDPDTWEIFQPPNQPAPELPHSPAPYVESHGSP